LSLLQWLFIVEQTSSQVAQPFAPIQSSKYSVPVPTLWTRNHVAITRKTGCPSYDIMLKQFLEVDDTVVPPGSQSSNSSTVKFGSELKEY
jgi:hypothetical protein